MVRQLLAKAGPGVAVIVNEFGETGIDGELLQGNDVDILEMPSGCICCTLKNDLVRGLNELYLKAKPKQLIMEPSGLADTSALLGILTSPNIKAPLEVDAIITIVEPEMFLNDLEEGSFGNFYYDQISNADLILINKCDLSTPEEIEHATRKLEKINDDALILPAVHCQVNLPEISGKGKIAHEHEDAHEHPEEEHYHQEVASLAFRRQNTYTPEKIKDLLERVVKGEFGKIYRAKGFFRSADGVYYFDLVRSRWEVKRWERPLNDSRFVFIGHDLGDLVGHIDLIAEAS